MKLRIELESNHTPACGIIQGLSCPIHETLAGNPDYIDNNIVLNHNSEPDTVILHIWKDDISDMEELRRVLHDAINAYLDSPD